MVDMLSGIPNFLCFRFSHVDETKAAIVLSMESVFGTIFSIIILHEVITLRMVIGCAIILAAVIISNLSETEGEAKDEEIQCSNF